MSMPGAAMMANRFSKSDEKKAEEESKSKKSRKREKEEDNDFGNHVDTPLLSEYMSVQGNTMIVLRGVGLVTGLNGTGGDPSPSALRTQLQNEMNRRGVKDSKRILASRDTAMVVVTAYLPAMVRKGQRFDVRVALPPNSNAKSLKGGWLLETRMFEEQNVEGRGSLKGHNYAVAGGAILTSLGVKDNREERQAELMSGAIPGGAISLTDRDLSIILRTEKRGSRNSLRVAEAVSQRFYRYNKYGQRITCAEAKDDARVVLKTHDQYINNFPRYQAVIRSLALNESDVARRIRMEMLARDILDVEKCQNIVSGVAACPTALQLEAIGDEAIPFLTDALESDSFDVRFQAAQSLAYLGNAEGVEVLHEAARDQPAFRVYALVALSVVDDADAVLALRQLMSEKALETRYGAFRALKELDPHDPSLNPIEFENRFIVYAVDSTGEPMVHVTRRRAPEVVLFGTEQALRLPAVLNAGRNITIMGETGQHEVEVIYYQLNAEPKRQKVPNRLIDILRTCGNLGATYPDIVQMMIEAEQQHNFVGQFGIDRLPQAGRLYTKNIDSPSPADEEDVKRIGNSKMIPELFDELDEEELKENESDEKLMNLNSPEAFDEVRKEDAKQSKNPAGSKPGDVSSTTGELESEPSSEQTSGDDAESEASVTKEQSEDASSEDSASEESASGESDVPEETEVEAPKKSFRERLFGKKKTSVSGLTEPAE
ncbi:MAG: flagellar basal body P-ring protein FlgI [Planctomycetaceae bacterium]